MALVLTVLGTQLVEKGGNLVTSNITVQSDAVMNDSVHTNTSDLVNLLLNPTNTTTANGIANDDLVDNTDTIVQSSRTLFVKRPVLGMFGRPDPTTSEVVQGDPGQGLGPTNINYRMAPGEFSTGKWVFNLAGALTGSVFRGGGNGSFAGEHWLQIALSGNGTYTLEVPFTVTSV
jgi:hypothetical protein